jgi:hypothetical protein
MQRFQARGRTEDRPHSEHLPVTTRAQDRYIQNTRVRNHFHTAIATAVNTPCKHNNRISAQTVRNCNARG